MGLDRVAAAIALVLLAPLMVVIAITVRVSSPGPALHRATRFGAAGRTFTVWKFRTMRCGAAADGPLVTASGDPRVTGVGRLLRVTKLDELPQLWNVVRGEMRVVGWRPEDPAYLDADDARQVELLAHLPGLTSPASIAYRHEERILADVVARGGDLDEAYGILAGAKSALDAEYLRDRTLRSDLGVLARTVASIGAPPRAHGAPGAALDEVYRRYDASWAARWSQDRPGNVRIAEERQEVAAHLLDADEGRGLRLLDIGAGSGGGFPDLFPEALRIRLDLLLWRLGGRRRSESTIVDVCADGRALPYPDASIDVVLLSVVLSSIPKAAGRELLAEVERVVRPAGVVVIYELRVPNPRNQAIHLVSRRWIADALPGFETTARSVTLVPPLARRLGPRAMPWYDRLGRLRATRTHNVIVGVRCGS